MIFNLNEQKVLSDPSGSSVFKGEKDFNDIVVNLPDNIDGHTATQLNYVMHFVDSDGGYSTKILTVDSSGETLKATATVSTNITSKAQAFYAYVLMTDDEETVIGKTNGVIVMIHPVPDEENEIIPPADADKIIKGLEEIVKEATETIETATDTIEEATEAISSKQDKLTAGENITISDDNVISASSGSNDYTDLINKPSINNVTLSGNKTSDDLSLQGKLTAGNNITINNGVISARGGVTSYNNLADKPRIRAWKRNGSSSSFNNLQGILGFEYLDFEYIGAEGDISIKLTDKIFRTYTNTFIGWGYDFNIFASAYAIAGVFWVRNERISNLPSVFTYFDTSNPARSYIFHYFDPVKQTGATVQIIRQVIYLDTNGDTRNFIQLANATKNSDGSYSVSNANGWVELTGGGSQIVSGVVNANGTITFTDSDGGTFNTSGSNLVTSGNEQISMGYDEGGFYFLFDDGQEGE